MLVSAKKMLQEAKANHYAVGQFNINNLEWTKAVLSTAQENQSPVILGVSEGAGKYMGGYKTIVGMVNGMLEEMNITVPVALHLDHGSFDACLILSNWKARFFSPSVLCPELVWMVWIFVMQNLLKQILPGTSKF